MSRLAVAVFIVLAVSACAKVRLEAPVEPVVFEVNVRIDLDDNAERLLGG